ncbi:MAG: DNA-processing protein DprA [Bacteroidales bacterium]|nr:DNA-processing protein DprA [Bacteroidales bacterium]
MKDQEELIAQLNLALLPGVGAGLVRTLFTAFGSASAILREKRKSLEKIPGIGTMTAKQICRNGFRQRAEEEIRFMQKEKITPLFLMDDKYPDRLKQCPDAPVILFYKGRLEYPGYRWISFIGTRKPSSRGVASVRKIISSLAKYHRLVVVSGLAYGVDIQAHRSALEAGLPTVAVLGHGFHTLYPAIHRSVAREIMDQGALVTDFFSHNTMDPKNFIKRNRIIAGLSEGVLIAESGLKGGATTTAEMANSYNRDVFAIPGRSSDEQSKGCNWLIRTNQATLVESAEDLEYFLGLDRKSKNTEELQKKMFNLMDREEKEIWDLLENHKLSIDELARQVSCPYQRLSTLLIQMEFKGFIRVMPGKQYHRSDQ